MAYVPVPKDLAKVKSKVAFNLTRRQIICFALAAAVAVPVYFLTRNLLGQTLASMLMVTLALPFFLLAMYERDGIRLCRHRGERAAQLGSERPHRRSGGV